MMNGSCDTMPTEMTDTETLAISLDALRWKELELRRAIEHSDEEVRALEALIAQVKGRKVTLGQKLQRVSAAISEIAAAQPTDTAA